MIHGPIIKQDGVAKNDCERNAAKRLLPELKKQFPNEKIITTEDALGANGPHIRAIEKEGSGYVIGVRPDGNKYLFELVERLEKQGKVHRYEVEKDGFLHKFRYVNDIPLNSDDRGVRVSFLDCRQISLTGKKANRKFTWATNFRLAKLNVEKTMRAGRGRWKIENETFNTLKNQGYRSGHNFGHGNKHLCTVPTLLVMLAFFVGQLQQGWNIFFQAAWIKAQTKAALWDRARSKFNESEVASMEMVCLPIIGKLKVKYGFYQDSGQSGLIGLEIRRAVSKNGIYRNRVPRICFC